MLFRNLQDTNEDVKEEPENSDQEEVDSKHDDEYSPPKKVVAVNSRNQPCRSTRGVHSKYNMVSSDFVYTIKQEKSCKQELTNREEENETGSEDSRKAKNSGIKLNVAINSNEESPLNSEGIPVKRGRGRPRKTMRVVKTDNPGKKDCIIQIIRIEDEQLKDQIEGAGHIKLTEDMVSQSLKALKNKHQPEKLSENQSDVKPKSKEVENKKSRDNEAMELADMTFSHKDETMCENVEIGTQKVTLVNLSYSLLKNSDKESTSETNEGEEMCVDLQQTNTETVEMSVDINTESQVDELEKAKSGMSTLHTNSHNSENEMNISFQSLVETGENKPKVEMGLLDSTQADDQNDSIQPSVSESVVQESKVENAINAYVGSDIESKELLANADVDKEVENSALIDNSSLPDDNNMHEQQIKDDQNTSPSDTIVIKPIQDVTNTLKPDPTKPAMADKGSLVVMYREEDDGQITCSLCDQTFTDESSAVDHYMEHEKEELMCRGCKAGFGDNREMKEHQASCEEYEELVADEDNDDEDVHHVLTDDVEEDTNVDHVKGGMYHLDYFQLFCIFI